MSIKNIKYAILSRQHIGLRAWYRLHHSIRHTRHSFHSSSQANTTVSTCERSRPLILPRAYCLSKSTARRKIKATDGSTRDERTLEQERRKDLYRSESHQSCPAHGFELFSRHGGVEPSSKIRRAMMVTEAMLGVAFWDAAGTSSRPVAHHCEPCGCTYKGLVSDHPNVA